MTILAAVSDLIFRSKIKSVGAEGLSFIRTSADFAAASPPTLLIVDLALKTESPIDLIRSARERLPDLRILAFGSHVETELFDQAESAGANEVMARSKFTAELPGILRGDAA